MRTKLNNVLPILLIGVIGVQTVFAQEGAIKFQIPLPSIPVDSIVIEVKTSPEAASIYLNKEKIGTSPAEYKTVLPGQAAISIQKENYEPWDTTLTLQPAQKLKINVALREKSIFSKEGEIDLPKILAKDTTVAGYNDRKGRVQARIAQVGNEINIILANFGNSYPALEPQKPGETAQDFESRKTLWQNEGLRQVEALRQKHEAYRNKLLRSIEVLEDNMAAANIAAAEALKAELAKEAAVAAAEAPKAEMAKEAAVAAAKPAEESAGSGGLSWRGWTRVLAFTATAVFGTVAAIEHFQAQKHRDEISKIDSTKPNTNINGEYTQWYEKNGGNYNSNKTAAESKELYRNAFGIGAGVFAVAGTLTFIF